MEYLGDKPVQGGCAMSTTPPNDNAEITDEMIEAGTDVLMDYRIELADGFVSCSEVVLAVYLAMQKAHGAANHQVSSNFNVMNKFHSLPRRADRQLLYQVPRSATHVVDQPWTIMSIGLRDWAHRF